LVCSFGAELSLLSLWLSGIAGIASSANAYYLTPESPRHKAHRSPKDIKRLTKKVSSSVGTFACVPLRAAIRQNRPFGEESNPSKATSLNFIPSYYDQILSCSPGGYFCQKYQ
jgi:hypothetical protein